MGPVQVSIPTLCAIITQPNTLGVIIIIIYGARTGKSIRDETPLFSNASAAPLSRAWSSYY